MTSRSSLSSLHDGGKPYHYLAFPATGLPVFLLTVNQLKEFGSLDILILIYIYISVILIYTMFQKNQAP